MFDTINHNLLMIKLEKMEFRIVSKQLMASYLSERKQRTKIENDYSDCGEINYGVPQDTVLGPLLST